MRSNFKIALFIIFSCWASAGLAQSTLDSLSKRLASEKRDTQIVKILNEISWEYSYSNLDSALICANKAYSISKKANFNEGIIASKNMFGIIYRSQSKFDKAIKEFDEIIEMRKAQKAYARLIPCYANLANVYLNINDNVKAIEYYNKALAIAEQIKRDDYVITLINNMSVVYKDIGLYDIALTQLNRALVLNKKVHDEVEEANSLVNIANIFQEKKLTNEAIRNNLLALKIYKKHEYKELMANVYNNLGICYKQLGDLQKAIGYANNSVLLYRELEDDYSLALSVHNLGNIYHELKIYKKAIALQDEAINLCLKIDETPCLAQSYLSKADVYLSQLMLDSALYCGKKGLALIQQSDLKEEISEAYQTLSEIYFLKNDFKNAYLSQQQELLYKDSVTSKGFTSSLASLQTLYEVDKKENEIKLLTQDGVIQTEKMNKQRILTIAIILILILVAAFGLFSYKAFVNKKKDNRLLQSQKIEIEEKNEELNQQNEEISAQRDQIEIQKHKVEEHQKEIIDSITYAKRLQQAILPPVEFITEYFPEHFLLYKPKDIVAGDFYWAHVSPSPEGREGLPAGQAGEGLFFIAAADSTGHGVPGAMVSVICSNALNRSVKEFGLTDTGKILDKTRELVLETFAKSSSDVKDGMDISLMCYDRKNKELSWSGANNPLWYINETGLNEVKANKEPIGKTDNSSSFTTHYIKINKGDCVYLFTDGYPDQFGGAKGKKFKYKQLEELLVNISSKSMNEQCKQLDVAFENWKGRLEQVDDVTIVGIRI